MIGWYILGGIVLLVLLVLLLRVGVDIRFGETLQVEARIGPGKITVLPRTDRPGKKQKEEQKPPPAEKKEEKKEKKKLSFTFSDVRSAAPVLFAALKKALGRIRHRMRIDPLHLSICFGGEDPSQVAQVYGWTNAAVWTAMPQLERLIHIRHPYIHTEVDYNRVSTRVEGEVGISFRIGDLLCIAFALAIPALKWYLAWQKDRKKREAQPGTKTEEATREKANAGKDATRI